MKRRELLNLTNLDVETTPGLDFLDLRESKKALFSMFPCPADHMSSLMVPVKLPL